MFFKLIWVAVVFLLCHYLEGAPVTETSSTLNERINGYFIKPLDDSKTSKNIDETLKPFLSLLSSETTSDSTPETYIHLNETHVQVTKETPNINKENDLNVTFDDSVTKNISNIRQEDEQYIVKHLYTASGRLTRMFRRRNIAAVHELNKFMPLCNGVLSDYCQFIQSDPDHKLNVTPCTKSWAPPSASTNVTATRSETQLVNLLKSTANRIYNISFTILLQEACGRPPCGKEQYLAFANKTIEQLVSNYDLLNRSIHLVAVLEDAIYKLSSRALSKRTVPSASELMNINLGDTGSVVQVLRTSCNEIH